MASYVAFVLSFFHHLFFVWCLGSSVLRDYGIFWVSSLIFFIRKAAVAFEEKTTCETERKCNKQSFVLAAILAVSE